MEASQVSLLRRSPETEDCEARLLPLVLGEVAVELLLVLLALMLRCYGVGG
jgi:hypothetical protein